MNSNVNNISSFKKHWCNKILVYNSQIGFLTKNDTEK
ncbi:hypothetical protein SRABI04_01705 [Chryseobacterium sp. Bi04]|nr:hypothetical protein SRABI04_01705 [Chryseobacterium sp. Bi04]